MADRKDWIVGGFQFGSENDANVAREELKKIRYMESKMRYDKPEAVLGIYNKIIEQRVFQTPVGFKYLQDINTFLQEKGLGDRANSIPLYNVFSREEKQQARPRLTERRVEVSPTVMYRKRLRMSVLINIALIILVIAMFVITIKSDNPNILNYENVLQDKYASWEQELTAREAAIRAKELELSRQGQ